MKYKDIAIAWLQGERVQLHNGIKWVDLQGVDSVERSYEFHSEFLYRIAPKSRYLNVYNCGDERAIAVKPTWEDNLASLEYNRTSRCIGYIEDKQDGSVPVFHPIKHPIEEKK